MYCGTRFNFRLRLWILFNASILTRSKVEPKGDQILKIYKELIDSDEKYNLKVLKSVMTAHMLLRLVTRISYRKEINVTKHGMRLEEPTI